MGSGPITFKNRVNPSLTVGLTLVNLLVENGKLLQIILSC